MNSRQATKLRSILPEGHENARKAVLDVFAPADPEPELRARAAPLVEWLLTVLASEYDAASPVAPHRAR